MLMRSQLLIGAQMYIMSYVNEITTPNWCSDVFISVLINILLQKSPPIQRFDLKPIATHNGVICTRSSNKKRCIYIYNFTIPDLTQRSRQAIITTPLIVSSERRDVCILNVITAKGAYLLFID